MSDLGGLYRPASLQPFYTEERCHITEYMNTDRCGEVSLAQCRVAAGVTTQLHALSVAERYVVQQGEGRMELGGDDPDTRQVFAVGPGDCVLIPPGCAQRIKNTGAQDLVFLCICTPRFQPQHYAALEQGTIEDIVEVD
jgi:mannose-6-phosphate isomerase-like protein (cupin superfamily)